MMINIQDDILQLAALGLLDRLLVDKATGGNILWATDAYAHLGEGYAPGDEIRPARITGNNSDLIKTRARRAMEQRAERTRQHAEVATPRPIVQQMNDFADKEWFDRPEGFHQKTDSGKIDFPNKKTWKSYVDARRLEITCGEAPFLASRYDVETGEALPIEQRFGLLDRKLKAVSQNARDQDEYKSWALRAVQAIYGYELQGDSLLIARVNILCTVQEHFRHRWQTKPDKNYLGKLCNVICWNLWQMDGLEGSVPVPPAPKCQQLDLFPPKKINKILRQWKNLFGEVEPLSPQNSPQNTPDPESTAIPCVVYDWRAQRRHHYSTLREKGASAMKFDFIIGNPPYQDETVGEQKTFAPPIYHHFMDAAYQLADKVELIHPARFLFNAGSTPKAWNKKMLADPHFKVLFHEQNSAAVFSGTDIRGGGMLHIQRCNQRIWGNRNIHPVP